jgi:hypothetical protein
MFSVMRYICQIKILAEKIIQGVIDRLENSKNQRKIGFLSFEQGFEFFGARNLTRNDS